MNKSVILPNLPIEIINLILSFREIHPIAKILKPVINEYIENENRKRRQNLFKKKPFRKTLFRDYYFFNNMINKYIKFSKKQTHYSFISTRSFYDENMTM